MVDISGMAPARKIYEDTGVNKEEIEQRGFDIWYKREIELWMERRTTLEINWTKAYAHVFNQYFNQ